MASTVANANRTKGRPLTPQDFMPRFGATPRRHQTAAEQYQTMRMWVAATGGKVIKRGEC